MSYVAATPEMVELANQADKPDVMAVDAESMTSAEVLKHCLANGLDSCKDATASEVYRKDFNGMVYGRRTVQHEAILFKFLERFYEQTGHDS